MHAMSILLRPLCGAMLFASGAAFGADLLPVVPAQEAATAPAPASASASATASAPVPGTALAAASEPAAATAPVPDPAPTTATAPVSATVPLPGPTSTAAARAPSPAAAFAPANATTLEQARGGTEVISNEARLSGVVSNNSATQITTGANVIQSNSFANASGIPVVIQNSGANVLIQNATVINLQLK